MGIKIDIGTIIALLWLKLIIVTEVKLNVI